MPLLSLFNVSLLNHFLKRLYPNLSTLYIVLHRLWY